MLRKLLKYELKATRRVFLPLYLALLVFALFTKLTSAFTPQWRIPVGISGTIYTIIMASMFVMTLVVMIQRFYRNLLSDEGYLMFTLPTKPWMHIVSKLLASMLWIAASVIVAIFSVLIITFNGEKINGIIQGFSVLFSQIARYWTASASLTIFEIIIATLISVTSGILLIYASIAIGHLFNKHKTLASFGAFIILNTLSQIVVSLIGMIFSVTPLANLHVSSNNVVDSLPMLNMALAFGIVISGLGCVAYFAITNYVLGKQLNLE